MFHTQTVGKIKTHILCSVTSFENRAVYGFFCGAATQLRVMASSFLRFLDQTQRRSTVGRTPLDE